MKRIKYTNNYTKLSPDLHKAIASLYKTGKYTTESLAKTYNVTTRTVQRIAKKHGVIRTQAEANKMVAPLKAYYRMRVPEHLKKQRKQISQKLRYHLISNAVGCGVCGAPKGSVPLHVDHIDNDATNNDLSNLQVLCAPCNTGKSHLDRFGL
jgi:5-methylcytosine-specific restriction endonuclease McrA